MSLTYLLTTRLETIRGSINVFSALIKGFPGKEISLLTDNDRLTLLVSLTYLSTIRLEIIRDSINIFKALIKISPGKEISLKMTLTKYLYLLTHNKTRVNQGQYQHLQGSHQYFSRERNQPDNWHWPTNLTNVLGLLFRDKTRDSQGLYQHLQGSHQDFSRQWYQPDNDFDRLTLLMTLTYLPTIRLETIRGSINIFKALIKISPGNEISLMASSDGSARRRMNPSNTPRTTPVIVSRRSRLSLHHDLSWKYVPRHEKKTVFGRLRPGSTKTGLLSYRAV